MFTDNDRRIVFENQEINNCYTNNMSNKIIRTICYFQKDPNEQTFQKLDELESLFKKTITPRVEEIFAEPRDKKIFYELVEDIRSEWEKGALTAFPDTPNDVISDMFESALDKTTHNTILQKRKRPDGRATDEIRTIYAEAGILPRTHGSGLFFRGDTHILSVATLGSPSDEQLIDTIGVKTSKRFMHHYNFPP